MEESKLTVFDKIILFIKKYAWAFSILFAVLAIAFTLLPVLNYEIREKVYYVATDTTKKLDYVYDVT